MLVPASRTWGSTANCRGACKTMLVEGMVRSSSVATTRCPSSSLRVNFHMVANPDVLKAARSAFVFRHRSSVAYDGKSRKTGQGESAGLNVDRLDVRFHFDVLFEDHLLGFQHALYQRPMNEHVRAKRELVCRASFKPRVGRDFYRMVINRKPAKLRELSDKAFDFCFGTILAQ